MHLPIPASTSVLILHQIQICNHSEIKCVHQLQRLCPLRIHSSTPVCISASTPVRPLQCIHSMHRVATPIPAPASPTPPASRIILLNFIDPQHCTRKFYSFVFGTKSAEGNGGKRWGVDPHHPRFQGLPYNPWESTPVGWGGDELLPSNTHRTLICQEKIQKEFRFWVRGSSSKGLDIMARAWQNVEKNQTREITTKKSPQGGPATQQLPPMACS